MSVKKPSYVFLLVFLAIVALEAQSAPSAFIDAWRASDLATLNDGDAVGSWTSASNRTVTASVANQPQLKLNATPASGAVVRFNRNWLKMPDNSPVSGLTNFSLAIVFKADAPGAGNAYQWYGKTGLVDAEQGGVTQDWGTVIDENGQVGLGIGGPDTTAYSLSGPSLVDGNYHAAVFTWGGGFQSVFVDGLWEDTIPSGPSAPRNDVGLSIGGIHTGEGGDTRRLVGDIAETRFYRTNLAGAEISSLIQELTDTHIAPGRPVIRSFTANTNLILIGAPVTLRWNATNATAIQIDHGIGPVTGPVGNIQVFPRTNTTYTLTATNTMALRTAQVTVWVDQGIPVANHQSVTTSAGFPLAVTLTGSDPQASNLTYAVLTAPLHGALTGVPPSLTYTPVAQFVGNDQFTFKVNDGEFDSPPATVAIQVLAPPVAPSAIILSTTNIPTSAVPGSFIATVRALDMNPDDTHTYLLVEGFGDNAQFVLQGNQLNASSIFMGGEGKTFTVRILATDQTGLWLEQDLFLAITRFSQSIVINEVHYHPPDNTLREEFIELHNPSASDIDVSLWRLNGGIDFPIPPGNVIPGGGFLVLAEDPATIQARYRVQALGPWDGGLSSDGETLTLIDANDRKVNEVSYRSEFPWPVGANGTGGSMALVNPSLESDLGSSWRVETPPTPGKTNRVLAINAPPHIRQVRHWPQSPASTNSIVFTAKVTDPEGVASVQLQYQVVTAGNYIPSVLPIPVNQLIANPNLEPTPNPAFENPANWLSVPMVDDGADGDAQAGDDLYTAVLPPQANRALVRYRILVTDSLGASRRAPFEDDPSLNFACFVYDGVPSYGGISSQALQSLPIYHLISRPEDVTQCTAYDGTYQLPQFASNGLAHPARFAFNWPGTMIYDGVVYDSIRYRLHGANGRYQPGKRNWRFEFNRGHYLAAHDQNGKPFARKWAHLTAGKGSNNRLVLTFGLNEVINYFLWNKVGVPAPQTFFFHFRVLDGSAEAADPYNGDFWGLNWAQEDYDGRFLESHRLAKGNLYKLINASRNYDAGQDMLAQQRYQGPFAVTNGSDGVAIQRGLLSAQSSDWIRAHVNCPEWYRFHAVCEAVRNYDFWPDANKNAGWYFKPPYASSNDYYGRLWVLPWDTDSTWGPTWNSGQDLVYNGIFLAASHPDLKVEYANAIREMRDLLFQPDQINPLIDAFAAQIAGFVPADLQRWSNAPASGGNYVSLSSGAGFVSPALSAGLAGYVQDLKNFMFVGGSPPWWIDRQTVPAGGWITRLDTLANDSAVPDQPIITYAGPTNFPVTGLRLRSSAFSDPQGTQTFAAMQWRVAEITLTNGAVVEPALLKLEWDAVWDSGELTAFTNEMKVPAFSVLPGHVYRARVRHKDTSNRWSKWSSSWQFTPTATDLVSDLQRYLVISEIMYHPPDSGMVDGSEFEFIELQNIGPTTLDLSGLTFSQSIDFVFTNGTTLAPGRYFVLGRNADMLQQQYPGLTVNGIYTGKLSNSGETIAITHPGGIDIVSVTYGDLAPWPVSPDGYGFSLQRIDPTANGNDPVNWQAAVPTPGAALPVPVLSINLQIQLDSVSQQPTLSFRAEANRGYALQYKNQLDDPTWSVLAGVPALSTNRTEIIKDTNRVTARFYRVITPFADRDPLN